MPDLPGSTNAAREFHQKGWCRFPVEDAVLRWVAGALPFARAARQDPAFANWLDCEGTWFVGVNALPNDKTGRVDGGDPISGAAMDFIADVLKLGNAPLDPAQVSIMYPGYPRPRRGETAAAFRYRTRRDAAHVDGLRPVGPARARMILEPHAYVLGLPLVSVSDDAAPMVVWEGSHRLIREAFRNRLHKVPEADWGRTDITAIYQETRQRIFDTCQRVTVTSEPGGAYILHRHVLHGVAPWADGVTAGPDGRMIAYFRPDHPGGIRAWLNKD